MKAELGSNNTGHSRRKAMDILGETTLEGLLYAQRAVQPNGCWLWMGAKSKKGYGMLKVALPVPGEQPRLVRLLTHWVAYRLWKGEIPRGQGLCHSPLYCGKLGVIGRACFNPSHLRPCTRSENERDKREKRCGEC